VINRRSGLARIPAPRLATRPNGLRCRAVSSAGLNTTYFDASVLIAGCLYFGGLTLTEPTERRDYDEAWEVTLDDEDDPERDLVELLAVRITIHLEVLNDEAAAFAESGQWSREQRGANLRRTMPCDVWR